MLLNRQPRCTRQFLQGSPQSAVWKEQGSQGGQGAGVWWGGEAESAATGRVEVEGKWWGPEGKEGVAEQRGKPITPVVQTAIPRAVVLGIQNQAQKEPMVSWWFCTHVVGVVLGRVVVVGVVALVRECGAQVRGPSSFLGQKGVGWCVVAGIGNGHVFCAACGKGWQYAIQRRRGRP